MADQWRHIDKRFEVSASALSPDDECYYYLDHTSGGYQESQANQDIFNLKKPMDRKGKPGWRYKGEAIRKFSRDLSSFLNVYPFVSDATILTAIPTSKRHDSPEYDDRIIQVIQNVSDATGIAWAETFEARADVRESHNGGSRSIEEIAKNARLLPSASVLDVYETCILVDDVITSGAHFIACKQILQESFPHLEVAGVFWAFHRWTSFEYGFSEF